MVRLKKASNIVFVIFVILVSLCNARTTEQVLHSDSDSAFVEKVREQWSAKERLFRSTAEGYVNDVFPALMKAADAAGISPDCKAALVKVIIGVKKLRFWAIRKINILSYCDKLLEAQRFGKLSPECWTFLEHKNFKLEAYISSTAQQERQSPDDVVDASGKIPMGIMTGTSTALGSYDQCLDISHQDPAEEEPMVGQYCTLNIRPPDLPRPFKNASVVVDDDESFMKWMYEYGRWMRYFPIRIGVCIPSHCEKLDLEKVAKFLVEGLTMKAAVGNCETKAKTVLTWGQLVILSTICIVMCLVIIGTLWERMSLKVDSEMGSKKEKTWSLQKILFSFSFTTNTKRLLFPRPSGPGTLEVIHGIRVFSCFWIILGHTYFLADISTFVRFKRLVRLEELYSDFWFTVVENFLPVDTFFFVSGLLTVYSSWKKLKASHGQIPFVKEVLHRFWRMTPAYLFVIGLFLILPLVGSGPIWKETIDPLIENCKESWWSNVLYINNYYPYEKMCLLHTWFQAVNMQFFIVSLPVLWFLYKYTVLAAWLIGMIVVLACLATGFITYFYELPPALLLLTSEWSKAVEQLNMVYFQPFTHFGPFCIGMLCGYYLVKKREVKFSIHQQILGWTVSSACLLVALFGVYPFRAGYDVHPLLLALYAGVHRSLWSVGLAWLTVACATGHGGLLNTCFSWSGLVPLSTLSYLIYLLHPLIVYCHVGSTREIMNLDHFTMSYSFLGHVVISVGCAFLVYVTVELPFTRLESMVFRSRRAESLPSQTAISSPEESINVKTLNVKVMDDSKVY